jgi:hypothetical protein
MLARADHGPPLRDVSEVPGPDPARPCRGRRGRACPAVPKRSENAALVAASPASAAPVAAGVDDDQDDRDDGHDREPGPEPSSPERHGNWIPGRAPGKRLGGEQPALEQELGDLDGVQGGALAQVVADGPEGQPVPVRRVRADTTDENLVRSDCVARHRELL